MHVLLIDELTHFTEVIYRFLRSRVRMVGMNLPEAVKARFPRIICGSQPRQRRAPVGQAHLHRRRDLRPADRKMSPDEGGKLRQFIPAKLADNPSCWWTTRPTATR
jgi:hypothetical protein